LVVLDGSLLGSRRGRSRYSIGERRGGKKLLVLLVLLLLMMLLLLLVLGLI
jgi:hypothetical protein